MNREKTAEGVGTPAGEPAGTGADMVNHPAHYNQNGVETIEYIKEVLSHEEYIGFLKGNIMKYKDRAPYKGKREEDLKKAEWYHKKLQEEL